MKIMRRLYKFYRAMVQYCSILLAKFFGAKYNIVITNKNCDFLEDPKFKEGYAAAQRQCDRATRSAWNLHINQWAAFNAKQLSGDFVECGVYRGSFAMSNIKYIDFKNITNHRYYLFDTFHGPEKEYSSEKEYTNYKGEYPECYDFVVNSFKDYPNVVIVRGAVPKTLSRVKIEKVAYLSLDMNSVIPEIEAIKHFWPKMVTGAITVLDDYGWPGHENQKKAMDDFALSVGVKILSLPTGQGLIIKPLGKEVNKNSEIENVRLEKSIGGQK